MQTDEKTLQRVYAMNFAGVYPLYVAKAEKKGRTQAEVDEVIRWLTGYTQAGLQKQIKLENDFETFFAQAPAMHPNSAFRTQDPDLAAARAGVDWAIAYVRERRAFGAPIGAKQAIQTFVQRVTDAQGKDFVPPEQRIAVFDNDGTLWPENPMPFQMAFKAEPTVAVPAMMSCMAALKPACSPAK